MSVHSSWTWIRVPAQVCLVSCARVTPTCHGTSKLMANWLVTSGQNRTRYQPHVFVPLGAHVAVLVTGKSTQRSCYMVKRSGKLEFSLVQSRFQSRFQDVNLSMASHGWTKIIQLAKKSYVTSTTEIVENKQCICSGRKDLWIDMNCTSQESYYVSQRHPNSNWRFTKYTDWRWTNAFLHQEMIPMTRLQKL